MHVFYTPDIDTSHSLPEEEAAHALRVLRLKEGDEICLTDGKGYFYDAVIDMSTNKKCSFTIKEKKWQEPYWSNNIHIALGPTKNMDRMEWFVEKATEIGVNRFSFLNCRYSERKVIKNERIEKIIISAVKQSLKAYVPQLDEMEKFEQFIKRPISGQKYIAHCYPGEKPELKNIISSGEDVLVLIGPEGDFSEEEVRMAEQEGFISVSLGKSRLRTETAALVATHIMNLVNQK